MDAYFSEFSRLGRRMFVLGPDALSVSGRRQNSRFDALVNLSDIASVRRMKVRFAKSVIRLAFLAALCFAGIPKMISMGDFYAYLSIWLFMLGGLLAYHAIRLLPAFEVTAFFDRKGKVLFDVVRTDAQRSECEAFIGKILAKIDKKESAEPGATDNPGDAKRLREDH